MRGAIFGIAAAILIAQAGPYAQGRGRGAAKPAPRETTVRVMVRDSAGGSIDGARVTLSGDSSGEFTTAGAGIVIMPNLPDGTYRVRSEKEGYVTLEREFTVKGGAPATLELVQNAQPAPPPPPPKPAQAAPSEVPPSGPPMSIVIADFVDKNFIGGREPMKESILSCKPLETVRLLQMRDAIAAHAHAEVDELVYVVAGEGSARLGDEVVALKPSSLVVVPRGLSHQFERRGKNPLIVLSTLTGEPCAEAHASK